MRGVFDSAGPRLTRAIAQRVFAFRFAGRRLLPDLRISELNTPPTYTPVRRFKCSLAACPRMARGQVGSLVLFLYEIFIHYSMPVYPDAIPARSLARLKRTFSRGFDLASYPTKPLGSYHAYRQLHGWVLPPLTTCAI